MKHIQSSPGYHSHPSLVPQPPVGGLTRSAALSIARRHDVTGCSTIFRAWTLGSLLSQPRTFKLPQQRLQPAQAIRDSPPKGSRTSRNRPEAGASPRPRTSRRPPQQAQPAKTRQTHTVSAPPVETPPSQPAGRPVHVGQELELECARLALEGKGVCLLPPTGFVVLVERTLPGERVRAEVVSVKRGYAEARKLASLSPHRNAVPPPCPYFGPCGGCTLQSLQYETQLEEKRNQVEQTLRRVGRLGPFLDQLTAEVAAQERSGDGGDDKTGTGDGSGARRSVTGGGVNSTLGCREPLAYRNKMMFHFSSKSWLPPDTVEDRPALGLLRPGTADVVLPVVRHGCMLQGPEANALLARVEELVSERDILPHNHPSGKGSLQHLIIRSGTSVLSAGSTTPPGAKELMAVFGVTHGSAVEQLRPVAEALGREFPQLASVVAQTVPLKLPSPRGPPATQSGKPHRGSRGLHARQDNRTKTSPLPEDGEDVPEDDVNDDDGAGCWGPMTLLYGLPYIHDVQGNLLFRISPGSFFQTNSRQAEVLYDVVRRAAALRPGAVDTVLDLYCGTGTFALSLASDCRRVVGVEVSESAVEDARSNAALNNITNTTFVCADVDTIQRRLISEAATQQAPNTLANAAAVPAPDVVIVDPARGGLSLGAAAFLSLCGARRVVYVSCNVATQARDLDRLCNGPSAPFRLVSVQPVDMFPHTDHVETVVVLDRKELGTSLLQD